MLFNGSEVKDDYMHVHALKHARLPVVQGTGNWAEREKGRGKGGCIFPPERTWPVCVAGVSELGKR